MANLPKKNSALTIKERRFIKALPTSKSGTAAAIEAGFSPSGAANRAHEMRKDPRLRAAIEAEMERQGLTDECLVRGMKEGLKAKSVSYFQHEGKVTDKRSDIDFPTRHRFLNTALQIKGVLRSPESDMAAAVGLTAIVAIIRAERAARGLAL